MHSIDGATGAWIWNFSTNGPIRCSPALSADGATLFFGSWDSIFYALSASTGALLWSFTTGGRCNGSPALGLDGATVYFGSWDYNLYALSTSTGSLQWTFSAQYAINDSPTVADNMIFFGSMDFFMYALDAIRQDGLEIPGRSIHRWGAQRSFKGRYLSAAKQRLTHSTRPRVRRCGAIHKMRHLLGPSSLPQTGTGFWHSG